MNNKDICEKAFAETFAVPLTPKPHATAIPRLRDTGETERRFYASISESKGFEAFHGNPRFDYLEYVVEYLDWLDSIRG
jgi:hypothetical protein